MQEDHRAAFDFVVEFSNGGGLKGWDFRLDIEGTDISDEKLGDYIVKDLRLLMVGSVSILNKRIFKESHKRAKVSASTQRDDAAGNDRLLDLSHSVGNGQITYPGLPAPLITDHLSHEASRERYAEGVTFQIGRIDMVANSGTAIDAPFHRYSGMADVAALRIEEVADIEAVVVRLTGMVGRAVTRQALLPAIDIKGKAVLIETGWSSHWGSSNYFIGHTYLTRDAAEHLREQGARLAGIDSLNIDDTNDPTRPVHSILLEAGIPIVENLVNLDQLPLCGFRFSAVPMRAQGMGAFPVRAWARITA